VIPERGPDVLPREHHVVPDVLDVHLHDVHQVMRVGLLPADREEVSPVAVTAAAEP
jgi:hypothetical protein